MYKGGLLFDDVEPPEDAINPSVKSFRK